MKHKATANKRTGAVTAANLASKATKQKVLLTDEHIAEVQRLSNIRDRAGIEVRRYIEECAEELGLMKTGATYALDLESWTFKLQQNGSNPR